MIRYKLLQNGAGVLLTRRPLLIEKNALIDFGKTDENALAIFKNGEGTLFYRELANGTCSLSRELLTGDMGITVAVPDGNGGMKKWKCDSLGTEQTENAVILFPAPDDVGDRITALILEMDDMRKAVRDHTTGIERLDRRITEIMEGYDLI